MDKQTTKGVSTPSKSSAKSGNCASSDCIIFVSDCYCNYGSCSTEM